MRNIVHDFNNIGGDLARRLASLFAFLKPDPSAGTQADTLGLALYADPACWLYGLLSYCAKACESKIEETNGVRVWKAKEEGGTPDIEATGRTLALMQSVVMSFGRNPSLGKPDLPVHHIHVYFPVQFVHKLVARMKTDLLFTDIAPEEGKEYKHNSESETPLHPSRRRPALQEPMSKDCWTAIWAKWSPFNPPIKAPYGLKYQCGQKWCKQCCPPRRPSARLHPGELLSKQLILGDRTTQPDWLHKHRKVLLLNPPLGIVQRRRQRRRRKPEGQGCFSFRQSLLHRAKDTYAARCTGNKYEVISRWLLTGLAVVLSRQNWQLLAKRGTLTATPQNLLSRYYQIGYPPGLKDKVALPYALPKHNAIPDAEWQRRVGWYCHSQYLADMEAALYAERAGSRLDIFYSRMNLTNPIQAIQNDQTEDEQEPNKSAKDMNISNLIGR